MDNFTAHQLHFTCQVQTPILLNEHQGSAIRGALFHALRNQFCFNPKTKNCGECAVWATCPICFLVATRNPKSERGVDVPRPYVIEPPLGSKISYQHGETLEFGLTMFAQALNLFPYVVLGSQALERGGLGKKLRREDGRWRRGTFAVQEIAAVNRLSGERQPILRRGDNLVQVPDLPITHQQVLARAAQLPRGRLTLTFKTPTRIIERGKLEHTPTFRPLIQRLHRRLRDLTREFTATPCYNPFDPIQDTEREFDFRQVMAQAEAVRVTDDQTRWVELDSFSWRRKASTPMGGFVGQVTFEGDLEPFLPWLVWGEVVHVGKDAVKGNGWYRIANCEWRMANCELRIANSEWRRRRAVMTYDEWEKEVTAEIKGGPVWKFYGYRKALFLYDLVWADCDYWQNNRRGWAIIEQIIDSTGSISANIEEGFGRGFGRDNARFLKIAVGSARETQGWYWRGRKLLPPTVYQHRIALLGEIIALLVTEINRQLTYAAKH